MPRAWVPERAAANVALPLPHATSSTFQPALRSAASASSSLASTIREATTAKSPLAQVFCWRALTTERSARAVVTVMMSPVPRAPVRGASVNRLRRRRHGGLVTFPYHRRRPSGPANRAERRCGPAQPAATVSGPVHNLYYPQPAGRFMMGT